MTRRVLILCGILTLSTMLVLGAVPNCEFDDGGLYPRHFEPIAVGGIDDRIFSYPWGVALFDGDGDGTEEVYIGTAQNALCVQLPLFAAIFEVFPDLTPPDRWECVNDQWDPENFLPWYADNVFAPVVFRGTPGADGQGWTWERVFEPSLAEATGFRGAVVFNDALYMLGGGLQGVGSMVWKTTDGVNWEEASERGVVSTHAFFNKSIRSTAIFNGRLYVGSASSSFIYASDDPAPGNWEVVNSNGYQDSGGAVREVIYDDGTSSGGNEASTLVDATKSWTANTWRLLHKVRIVDGTGAGQSKTIASNTADTLTVYGTWATVPDETSVYEIFRDDVPNDTATWQMTVRDGYLYAAPLNLVTGGELWKSADPAPGNWTRIIYGGYGNPTPQGFMTVTSFGDDIYLGTVVYPPTFDEASDVIGTELYRVNPDDSVDLLVGAAREVDGVIVEPLSGRGPGFDYPLNAYSWDATVYDGWYYVGTFDFGMIGWELAEHIIPGDLPPDWVEFLEFMAQLDANKFGGFDLYRTQDGIDWVKVSTNGFDDLDNYGIRSMKPTPWGLLIGTANPYDGFEVWMGNREN